ncbi:MAG: hypothetical protein ACFBRM_14960 [Pikeienuella sp.]
MSTAEEFDPTTGTFRPIAKPNAAAPGAPRAGTPTGGASRPEISRYGVLFDAFEDGMKSDGAKYVELGAKAIIVIVFLLLLYEAISYRISLM